jgi:hypothetical protein
VEWVIFGQAKNLIFSVKQRIRFLSSKESDFCQAKNPFFGTLVWNPLFGPRAKNPFAGVCGIRLPEVWNPFDGGVESI